MKVTQFIGSRGLLTALVLLMVSTASFASQAVSQDLITGSILKELRAKGGGLVVHLGCGDGSLTCALHIDDRFPVQGLDTDPQKVAAARGHIDSRGLYGPVSATRWDGENLPYIDNLVKVIVVSGAGCRVPWKEFDRVLTPGGEAVIRKKGNERLLSDAGREACAVSSGYVKITKPYPCDIDEWSHYLHGPDNNAVAHDTVVGPPRHMQWTASPEWTRNHHKLNSISACVSAGGRIFYIVDEATAANMFVPGKWNITARDAFSGTLLWKKPLASWAFHRIRFRSGPPQVTRLLIASGEHVYAPRGLDDPVLKLDAATGDTITTYRNTEGAEEMVLSNGVLLVIKGSPVPEHANKHPDFLEMFVTPNRKTLVAVDTDSGETIWTWSKPGSNPRPETLASDGGKVFMQAADGVVCLDLKSGDELWSYGKTSDRDSYALSFGKHTLVVSDGVVLCNLAGEVAALCAESGKKLWQRRAAEHGFHSPLDIFVINGRVWLGAKRRDSVAPPATEDFSRGLDLFTGEVETVNTVMAELQTAGHHHRCHREKATTKYIMTGKRGVEMMDLEGENHFRANWVRGSCQIGYTPANGLLYTPPNSCGCYMEAMLRGFNALASERPVLSEAARLVPDNKRMEKGPAYESTSFAPAKMHRPGEWAAYRSGPLRNGIAETELPVDLEKSWAADIGGALTQPVAAGGMVVVSSIDKNTVCALDESSGETAWTFTCGGRVDSPPSIYSGKVYFGSGDGHVYCLTLETGQLMWRFMCAPMDMRAVSYDRVESLWPVHGSVLVLDGKIICSAGRSTWLDNGIYLYSLDPDTGELLNSYHFKNRHPEFRNHEDEADEKFDKRLDQCVTDYKTYLQSDRSDSFSMSSGTTSDVLVSDGEDLFLHHVRFTSGLERVQVMSPHLFSTSSLLDGTENHRSHWVLGNGDFSRTIVAYPWIVNRGGLIRGFGLDAPYGVTMVFTEDAVWGVHRKGGASGKYTLFERENKPASIPKAGRPDFCEIPKDRHPYPFVWKRDIEIRPRALLKSGGHLFLGATPTDIPEDDPHAAYEGRAGGMLTVFSTDDGKKIAEYQLASPVVWDGMAAAHGHLFMSLKDGTLLCLGPGGSE